MARSSKKIKPMTYSEMNDLYEEYHNRAISKIANYKKGTVLGNLARTMRRKFIPEIQSIEPYRLQDEFADVTVELVGFEYNLFAHCGVACFHVTGVSHVTDATIDRIWFWNSYSSEQPETLYGVVDDILDKAEEHARNAYCEFERAIEDKKSKK